MSMPLEKNIEKRFCDRARMLGMLPYKFVSPMQRGVPDRLLILPTGETVYIEFKRPTGKLSKLQVHQIAKIEKQGARVFVIYSHEDADTILQVLKGDIDQKRVVLSPQGENLNPDDRFDGCYKVFREHGFEGDRDQFEAMFKRAVQKIGEIK